jgi:Na+-transporting methylmalonyl-CoA/oxaloacetate decarboxylase gamma subunit
LSSDFSTGLMVTVVGLSITFLALFIFIGVIMLLKVLFPYKEEAAEVEESSQSNDTACIEDEEVAAAIAAVVFLRGQRSSQLGSALIEGKSKFWTSD